MIDTEAGAKDWLIGELDVSRETLDRLKAFAALLEAENERQNLVSRSTIPSLWTRHILDSAQLILQAPSPSGSWLDLGSGAGFPGLIVATLYQGPVTLVESRKLRVDFLQRAAEVLGVNPTIIPTKVERLPNARFDVISARAFAASGQTLSLSHRFSTGKTRWILPKGASAQSELEAVRTSWHGEFRLVPSLTDPDASIIIAEGVRPRRPGDKR
jgi:16S rRNA (guanine527-N7)-methyltransferase